MVVILHVAFVVVVEMVALMIVVLVPLHIPWELALDTTQQALFVGGKTPSCILQGFCVVEYRQPRGAEGRDLVRLHADMLPSVEMIQPEAADHVIAPAAKRRSLVPVVQLCVCKDTIRKDSLKKMDRSLFRDFWQHFLDSLKGPWGDASEQSQYIPLIGSAHLQGKGVQIIGGSRRGVAGQVPWPCTLLCF
ncbi:unnamed protein product [Boreogadus saida]